MNFRPRDADARCCKACVSQNIRHPLDRTDSAHTARVTRPQHGDAGSPPWTTASKATMDARVRKAPGPPTTSVRSLGCGVPPAPTGLLGGPKSTASGWPSVPHQPWCNIGCILAHADACVATADFRRPALHVLQLTFLAFTASVCEFTSGLNADLIGLDDAACLVAERREAVMMGTSA